MIACGRHLGIMKVKADGRDTWPSPVLLSLVFCLSGVLGARMLIRSRMVLKLGFRGKVKKCCRLRQH